MLGLVVSPTAKEKNKQKNKQKPTEPLHCKQKKKKA